MSYRVKEIFYSLQGEGANTGRPAVFCRFTGCNLWSGREEDRAGAVCKFCDTDFVDTDGPGGDTFDSAEGLADALAAVSPCFSSPPGGMASSSRPCLLRVAKQRHGLEDDAMPPGEDKGHSSRVRPLVVCTGGEPLLQVDEPLIRAFHARGFEIAVETNGTRPVPAGIDWITVSPKTEANLVVRAGDELKLVYPQDGLDPESFAGLDFSCYFLQPMAGACLAENTERAVRYCLDHPQWRLSLQAHKILGIR